MGESDAAATPEECLQTRLYHYTSRDALIGISQSKCLWASSIYEMNDASEVEYLKGELLSKIRDLSESEYNTRDKAIVSIFCRNLSLARLESLVHVFVASFSERRDDLSQWRAYCPENGGVCIGFSSDRLKSLCGDWSWGAVALKKCIYEPEAQDAIVSRLARDTLELFWDRCLAKHGPAGDDVSFPALLGDWELLAEDMVPVLKELVLMAPVLKHPAFKEEAEWRLIIWRNRASRRKDDEVLPVVNFRNGHSSLIPYLTVDLKYGGDGPLELDTIVVGPCARIADAASSIETLCAERNIELSDGIQISKVPFRSW